LFPWLGHKRNSGATRNPSIKWKAHKTQKASVEVRKNKRRLEKDHKVIMYLMDT
jgi:hypothetical protein